jgi:hypothetical protein
MLLSNAPQNPFRGSDIAKSENVVVKQVAPWLARDGLENKGPSEILRLGRVLVQLDLHRQRYMYAAIVRRDGGVGSYGESTHDMNGNTSTGRWLGIGCCDLGGQSSIGQTTLSA